MNLLHIAFRNMQQRGLASSLTMISMALGVALVVIVLSISWVITESFDRNSNVGYNLIVGAKGGSLQLALNTVFYLSQPIEVIPYEEYLEFLPGPDGRPNEIKKIGGWIAEPERKGIFSAYTTGGFAIPVCLGDYVGRFRVVATKPEFFEKLRYGQAADQEYTFAAGRNFQEYSEEHGYFEAVVGANVARELGLRIGDTIKTTHGDPEGEGHGQPFTVVGILHPTGTPNDRAAFVNLEGFYLIDGHARAFEDEAHPESEKVYVEPQLPPGQPPRLPLEKRDLTAVLVRAGQPMFAVHMERPINKRLRTQAVSPVKEVTNMLNMFVTPVRNALLAVTIVVCVVSGVSILVSIYNSMNERRRDIAIMRALGARRDVVLMIVLLESLLIAVGGGLLGWLGGHALAALSSPVVEARTGIRISFFNSITWVELSLVPGIVVLATLAGIVPALAAYRTDVSKHLSN
ncbi:MAG: peptide ABC transporter permease [Pirellulaceae bacterium]|nr:MAG: peptide ABC transporter permease [Pirellulaceae bacterium]